jgi:Family of unknown function (DUF6173)
MAPPILPAFQIPRMAEIHLPDSTANPAKWMHERLVKSIIEFEKELDNTQEIGARLVNFGEREPIHILNIGYWGPDLVIFHGTNLDGRPVELLQHVSQISVLLVAIPVKDEAPRRIGFILQESLKPPADEGA